MSEELNHIGSAPGNSEDTHTQEDLAGECQVTFDLLSTYVDEAGAHAQGFIGCDMQKCPLYKVRDIPGNVEAGPVGDLKVAAEAKVLRRARGQMAECLVWKSAPENQGQDIPNDRLPENLRRS